MNRSIHNMSTLQACKNLSGNIECGSSPIVLGQRKQKTIGIAAIFIRAFPLIRAIMPLFWGTKLKEKAFENGLLIYSMWHGYKTKEALRDLLDYVVSEGMEIRDIHTSGHADAGTIRKLIEKTNPKRIIPVHTENAQWFVDTYGCERVVLRDGVIAEQTT